MLSTVMIRMLLLDKYPSSDSLSLLIANYFSSFTLTTILTLSHDSQNVCTLSKSSVSHVVVRVFWNSLSAVSA